MMKGECFYEICSMRQLLIDICCFSPKYLEEKSTSGFNHFLQPDLKSILFSYIIYGKSRPVIFVVGTKSLSIKRFIDNDKSLLIPCIDLCWLALHFNENLLNLEPKVVWLLSDNRARIFNYFDYLHYIRFSGHSYKSIFINKLSTKGLAKKWPTFFESVVVTPFNLKNTLKMFSSTENKLILHFATFSSCQPNRCIKYAFHCSYVQLPTSHVGNVYTLYLKLNASLWQYQLVRLCEQSVLRKSQCAPKMSCSFIYEYKYLSNSNVFFSYINLVLLVT